MKTEVTLDFMWHLGQVVIPFPVTIVTTVDVQGRINAAPFGLVLPFSSDAQKPQMLLCSASFWHTSRNIEATGEFVFNYAPYTLIEKVAQTGLMYSEGVNEIEKAGLTALPACSVQPPRIEECYQHIECRLNQVIRPSDMQTNFIGDVVSVSINEELLEKGREQRLKAADPLLLFGVDVTVLKGNYARLGETTEYAPPKTAVE